MDLRKVKKLIELVRESGIVELEVRGGEESVRIVSATSAPAGAPTADAPTVTAGASKPARGRLIEAPVSGTFYRSPAPGEPPFVSVGQTVKAGEVLCIIESMKMMNRIEADGAGTVAEVLLENGRAIESGTALFRMV